MKVVRNPGRCLRLRTISHHATWSLGCAFPKSIPLVFVTGYPKSGTTWVCQITADFLQLPFPRFSILPVGCPAVVHGHERVSRRYPLGIYVIRDGRDALVSKYFHLLRSLKIPEGLDPVLNRRQKAIFPGLRDRNDIRSNLPGFIERQMRRPNFCRANWAEHVSSFFDAANDNIVLLRYEELKQTPLDAFTRAMMELTGEEPEPDRIAATLEKFSFARQAGRREGQEDRTSFLRKGEIGDWRNHFTPQAAEIFDRYAGEALIRAGYESDRDWVRSLG